MQNKTNKKITLYLDFAKFNKAHKSDNVSDNF